MKGKIIFILLVYILVFSDAYGLQERTSVIRGRITDKEGNPLSGAGVTIENTFLGTHSAADGYYRIDGLNNGNYNIRISFIGYEPVLVSIDLEGEAVANVSLVQRSFLAGEVIVNATRAGSRSPLAYTSLDNEIISRQNSGHDIPYLLSLTPSLVETSEAGNGMGYTNLRIRGTDASRINVTMDGIPLNDPESQQVFWVDIPDVASSVDNIQVQRGAGTSTNGAGAFGATVNMQTGNPGNEPFARISTSLGSFNTSRKMIAAGSGLLAGKFAFQIRLSDLKSDGYIDRTGSDHQSAFINGAFRTARSFVKANIFLGQEHTGIGWWGVPGEVLPVNRKYNPAGEYTDENNVIQYYDNESDNYNQNHYQLFYDLKLSNSMSLSTAFHYTSGKGYYEEFKEDRNLSDYGLPVINTGEIVISKSDLIGRKWMNNDFYGLVYSLKYLSDKLETTFGGGVNYYSGDHYGRIIWMSNPGNTAKDHQWYLNNGKKGEISTYAKADYSLTDRLSLFADLQFRLIYYRMKGSDDDLKDLGQKHHYGFLNPKTGLFYSIDQNQDAYISFSVANREPTRADFKEAAGDPDAVPQPEKLYDTELGYKLRKEKYSAAINLYAMLYSDQLIPTGELSSTGYPIMTNVEKSRRLGIELSAGLRPADFFGWDLNLTLSSNKIRDFVEYYIDYNTSDWSQEYRNTNLGTVDIAYSPSATGTSDLNFRIMKNTELHIISKYVGKQYFDNTMSRERMIDPYCVSNLRIDFNPSIKGIKNAGFQLFINNILNHRYESNAYGGNWFEDGVEKTWSYFFPQAGINFMVKAELLF